MRRPSRSPPRAARRQQECQGGQAGSEARNPGGRIADRARLPGRDIARLSNGVELQYAQRAAVPVTQLALSFDAGEAADAPNGARAAVDGHVDARRRHRHAALRSRSPRPRSGWAPTSTPASSLDRSTVTLSALSANLGAVARRCLATSSSNPAFDPAELERVRTQRLTGDRAAAEGPERHRPARPAGTAVRRQPSLRDASPAAMPRRSAASPATSWSASRIAGCVPTG